MSELVKGIFTDVIFHDASTVVGTGNLFDVKSFKSLTIEIYGTSTGRTVTFYGRSASGADRALKGFNLGDWSSAVSTTGTGELWQFDITGLNYVFMELTAITDNNVSVKGRAVS